MDCGRPRQVSELWAALVRTTGLSNLPPWRACERTGQHLGRGEVTRDTRAGASRASTTVLARRFRADPHEVGRIEGLERDAWKLGPAPSSSPRTGKQGVRADGYGFWSGLSLCLRRGLRRHRKMFCISLLCVRAGNSSAQSGLAARHVPLRSFQRPGGERLHFVSARPTCPKCGRMMSRARKRNRHG